MTTQPPPDGLLEVGRIGKPHGVHGDLFVTLTSDVDERRSVGATFTVVSATGQRVLVVESARPQKDRFVVHFAGVDDRSAAEVLVNKSLFAEPVHVEGRLWVHELIGSTVKGIDGTPHGTCIAVIDNPAHDILELSGGALVPVTFVVSCSDGVTVIDPPPGLMELNSADKS